MIEEVLPTGSAKNIGLIPGDVILSIDGNPAIDFYVIHSVLRDTRPSQILRLRIQRNTSTMDVAIQPTIKESPLERLLADGNWETATIETQTILSIHSAQSDGYTSQSIPF